MEVKISTGKEDVKLLIVIGNSQVHVEDGVSTACKWDEAFGICGVYSHGVNGEGHRLIYKDIGLCSRGNFQFSSCHYR